MNFESDERGKDTFPLKEYLSPDEQRRVKRIKSFAWNSKSGRPIGEERLGKKDDLEAAQSIDHMPVTSDSQRFRRAVKELIEKFKNRKNGKKR